MKLIKKILIYTGIGFTIALLLPLCWICFTDICIDWANLTAEWYKILLSSFATSVLLGFIAVLFIELWKTTNNQQEIIDLISKQKETAKKILSNCNIANVKEFLSNHNQIIDKQPYYITDIIKGNIIKEQMLFFISSNKNPLLMKKAEKDIIEFCKNFLYQP